MKKRALIACALTLAAAAGGCASVLDALGGEDRSDVARGRNYAELQCGRCHSIGGGQSSNLAAPSFRTIRIRYNELSLNRELDAIEKVGHFQMPPLATTEGERRDLIAYIESLGQ